MEELKRIEEKLIEIERLMLSDKKISDDIEVFLWRGHTKPRKSFESVSELWGHPN